MRKFEILPHTADLRIKVEGDSLEELFLGALEGMNSVMKNDACEKSILGTSDILNIDAIIGISDVQDETTLLIDFLSEVLTRTHEKKAIFCKAELEIRPIGQIGQVGQITLNAKIFGQKVDEFDKDIKAVTYHEANIIKNAAGNYETAIVFDI